MSVMDQGKSIAQSVLYAVPPGYHFKKKKWAATWRLMRDRTEYLALSYEHGKWVVIEHDWLATKATSVFASALKQAVKDYQEMSR